MAPHAPQRSEHGSCRHSPPGPSFASGDCTCQNGASSVVTTSRRSEEHTSELQSHSDISTLSLHDALPIFHRRVDVRVRIDHTKSVSHRFTWGAPTWPPTPPNARSTGLVVTPRPVLPSPAATAPARTERPRSSRRRGDRKSTRLNSSHTVTSPLFPYTTLFRSSIDGLTCVSESITRNPCLIDSRGGPRHGPPRPPTLGARVLSSLPARSFLRQRRLHLPERSVLGRHDVEEIGRAHV